ncbi:DUF2490 domain-containing protein [Bacteroidota bacterium]
MKSFVPAIITSLLLLLTIPSVHAQYQDFRSWWDVELAYGITKDLDAKVEISQRFKENSLVYDRSVLTAVLAYEIIKDLSVRGGVRYLVVNTPGTFESRYRIHAGIQYQKKFDELALSIRERIQYGFNDLQSMQYYMQQKTISRTRLKTAYKIFGTPFQVHASYELFLDLNSGIGILPVANRVQLGLEYAFRSRSALDLSYIFEQEINSVNPLLSHIIKLGYTYEF